jgi:hypothetical protein
MADAFTAVEAAIDEVTKARISVSRKQSKQVSSADEIDQLKSVAFAWFQTHRPIVVSWPSPPDLSTVDAAYKSVMDSTGGYAARTTYSQALLKAKRALVEVRGLVIAGLHSSASPTRNTGAAHTTDAPPNFSQLVADATMQAILARRWDEVQKCISSKANLAATVMMGGLLESLLLARINGSLDKPAVFKSKTAPQDKTGKTVGLPEWKLVHMVDVAHELGWITKSAKDVGHVLRDFRNYIHPHKEHTDGVLISEDDACIFWEVTKAISRQMLGSVGKSP